MSEGISPLVHKQDIWAIFLKMWMSENCTTEIGRSQGPAELQQTVIEKVKNYVIRNALKFKLSILIVL